MILNHGTAGGRSAIRQRAGLGLPASNDENAMANMNGKKLGGGGGNVPGSYNENSFTSFKGKGSNRAVLGPSSSKKIAGTGTKTPKASAGRRALGDISNRKGGRNGGAIDAASVQKSAFKPSKSKAVTFQTPHRGQSGGAPFPSTKKATGTAKKIKSRQGLTPKTLKPTPSENKALKSNVILPQRTVRFDDASSRGEQRAAAKQDVEMRKPDVAIESPVEDIELPKGRLWHEMRQEDTDPIADISLDLDGCRISDIIAASEEEAIEKERRFQEDLDERDAAYTAQIEKLTLEEMMGQMDLFVRSADEDHEVDLLDDPWEDSSPYPCRPADDDISL